MIRNKFMMHNILILLSLPLIAYSLQANSLTTVDFDLDQQSNECSIEISNYSFDCNIEGLFFNLEYSALNINSELELTLNGEEQFITNDTLEGSNLTAFGFFLQPPSVQDYIFILRDVNNPLCADTLILNDFKCIPCEFISLGFSYDCQEDSTYTFTFESRDPNGPVDIFLDSVFVGTHTDGEPDFRLEGLTPNIPGTEILLTACSDFHECCQDFTFDISDCGQNSACIIESIEIQDTSCNADGSYNLTAFYDTNLFTSSIVDITINGVNYIRAADTTSTFTIEGIFPRTQSDFDIVTLCLNEIPSCCRVLEYPAPNCSNENNCALEFIEVDSLACQPNGSYSLFASYGISNPSNDFIEVYLNDQFYVFENTGILFIDSLIPGLNSDTGLLKICVNNNPNCCNEIEFFPPICEPIDCTVNQIEILNTSCNSDGTYDLWAKADINIITDFDINVNINGNDFVIQSDSSTFFHIDGILPRPQGDVDIITVCVSGFPNCCNTIEYESPTCIPTPCEFEFVEIDSLGCLQNGIYGLSVSYNILNSFTSLDLLEVSINNGNFQEFQQFSDFGRIFLNDITPRPNSDFDIITVCVSDKPNTCVEIEYLQPEECNTDGCIVELIEILETECNPDGSYNLTAIWDIDILNTVDITVNINGIDYSPELDSFSILTIADISPQVQSDFDIITFCVDGNPNSCKTIEYQVECSEDNCKVDFIEVDSIVCNPDGTYDLLVVYGISNTNNEFIDVFINNDSVQFYENNGEFIMTNITPRSNSEYGLLKICLNDNPDCCEEIEFFQSDCTDQITECNITDIEIRDITCTGDDFYEMFISFNTNFEDSLSFTYYINGVAVSNSALNQLPLLVSNININDSLNINRLTVCINVTGEVCCTELDYEQPNCLSNALNPSLVENIQIYPNPVNDLLHINESPQEVIGLYLLDNLGRQIRYISYQQDVSINVSSLNSGVYTLQFHTAKGQTMSRRFVKM